MCSFAFTKKLNIDWIVWNITNITNNEWVSNIYSCYSVCFKLHSWCIHWAKYNIKLLMTIFLYQCSINTNVGLSLYFPMWMWCLNVWKFASKLSAQMGNICGDTVAGEQSVFPVKWALWYALTKSRILRLTSAYTLLTPAHQNWRTPRRRAK